MPIRFLFLRPYIFLFIKSSVEPVILDLGMNNALEKETMVVPVESRIIMILFNHVIAKDKTVHRFGIQNRHVKGFELIVLNHDPAMEIFLLTFQIRYLRIDGNNGVRKLELICQRIDKFVIPDQHVMAGARLKPSVTVAAQQDCRTGSVIKNVILDYSLLRSAEQGTAGTVITDHIIGKINLRRPFQILDTVSAGFTNDGIDRLIKRYAELLCTMIVRLIESLNGSSLPLKFPSFWNR